MLTPDLWPRVREVSRIRIETKLIRGISAGKAPKGGKVEQALATWSSDYLKVFTLRSNAEEVIVGKLLFPGADELHYITRFFLPNLPEVILDDGNIDLCVSEIADAIKGKDEVVRGHLLATIRTFPNNWQSKFAKALVDETDKNNPAAKLRNGQPFLSSPLKDDDIPF